MKLLNYSILSIFLFLAFPAKADLFTTNELLKNLDACEENKFYQEKIKKGEINYLKKINIKQQKLNESIEWIVAIEGGTHLGVAYLFSNEKKFYRLEIGPIYEVITYREFPSLKQDELMIVSTTGGSGEHHIFVSLLKFTGNTFKIKFTLPLYGISDQSTLLPSLLTLRSANLSFNYQPLALEIQEDKAILRLRYNANFNGLTEKEQKEILKDYHLKNYQEVIEIVINSQGAIDFKGSQGVKKSLSWLFNNDKIQIRSCNKN